MVLHIVKVKGLRQELVPVNRCSQVARRKNAKRDQTRNHFYLDYNLNYFRRSKKAGKFACD
jgi:hypothetical protein